MPDDIETETAKTEQADTQEHLRIYYTEFMQKREKQNRVKFNRLLTIRVGLFLSLILLVYWYYSELDKLVNYYG